MRKNANKELAAAIGTRLKELREARKLTQQELADKAGIDIRVVGRIERGQVAVTVDTLEKVCKALEIGLSEMFTKL